MSAFEKWPFSEKDVSCVNFDFTKNRPPYKPLFARGECGFRPPGNINVTIVRSSSAKAATT